MFNRQNLKKPAFRPHFASFACLVCLAAFAAPVSAQTAPNGGIVVQKNGSQPSAKGASEYFTGTAWIDAPFSGTDPSRVTGATVTFEPGARTAWHTHPLGQTLIVTAGTGWIQEEGGEVLEIKAGDVVKIPPNVKHWHGATPTTTMTHVAVQEALDGRNVVWMEKVDEAQYKRTGHE